MKKILYLVLLFSTVAISQQGIVKVVECGEPSTIYGHEQGVVIDTLKFTTKNIMLIQDNATVYIYNVVGHGHIKRGGKGGAPTIGGIDRFPGDASPTITLIGDPEDFNTLVIEENIDFQYIEND